MDEPLNDTSGRANRKRKKAEIMARLRALDYTFHDKNLYAINNASHHVHPILKILTDLCMLAERRKKLCAQSW